MLRKTVTFKQATQYLEHKQDLQTSLKTKEIALWDKDAKSRSFFSARVASADILAALHKKCQDVIDGHMTDNQARELLGRFLDGDGAGELAKLGFLPQEDVSGSVAELASVRRLELIISQNSKMAQEVGHFQQWQENSDMFPWGIWRQGLAEEHRAQHKRHANKIFRYDHPIWRVDPPGGLFNCTCYREEITQEELDALGIDPENEDYELTESPLGFDPSKGIDGPIPIKPYMPEALKSAVKEEIEKEIQKPVFIFPDDPDDLKVVSSLGGSTGAELVEDENGYRFVRKRGGGSGGDAAGHLRNECVADAFYQALNVDVPEFRLYETDKGPVKLSRFIDEGKSLSQWWGNASSTEKSKMRTKLKKGFDVDVITGNWDVVGMSGDNILIDTTGKPWRIDNGGALGWRAMGAKKDEKDWEAGWPDDLWTMSSSSNNAQYFDKFTTSDVLTRIGKRRGWAKAIKELPAEDQKVMKTRLDELKILDTRRKDFVIGGYTQEYTDGVLLHSYNLTKEGFVKSIPKEIVRKDSMYDIDYKFFRSGGSGSGKQNEVLSSNNHIKNKILTAVKSVNYHNKPGGDYEVNMSSVNAALETKAELEKLKKAGIHRAGYYLRQLKEIEDAAKNKTQVGNINFSYSLQEPKKEPEKEVFKSKYISLTDHIHDYMRRNGGDPDFIYEWQDGQRGNSYDKDSCKWKVAQLFARGIDFDKAGESGYYMGGNSGSYQRTNMDSAIKNFKQKPAIALLHITSKQQYHAAIQLSLENCTFEGNAKKTRSVILARTEDDSVVTTRTKGEETNHLRGPNESHSIFNVTSVKGSNVTILNVPYSRVTGMYFYEEKKGHNTACFLGDGENEFTADTAGLTAIYAGRGSAGTHISKYHDIAPKALNLKK